MDNQVKEETVETGEGSLYVGNFPMFDSPITAQLTIHINNLFNDYDKGTVTKTFKNLLENPEAINKVQGSVRIKQIIEYYGVETCQAWFTLVYGWQFGEVG